MSSAQTAMAVADATYESAGPQVNTPAHASTSHDLPVIDLSLAEHPASRDDFHRNLAHIARHIGFFHLVGHGITPAEIRAIREQAYAFFALPQAEKDRIDMQWSPHFRGYTATGAERTRSRPDHREQIDIGAELPANPLTPDSPVWLRLQGPNQWPEGLPGFRETVLHWQARLREVAIRLLRAFMVALQQPADALDDLVASPPAHLLKLIHYPGSAEPSQQQGVGAHKDGGILTLLLQDRVGGLQVQTGDGWIDVPPAENTFVVNIGEILELATNGYLRATAHRVQTPPAGVDRYSIAYFISPRLAAGSVPVLRLPPHLAALATGPETDPLNPLLHHVGENSLKGRVRSHLPVTKRFYPEIYRQLVGEAGGEEKLTGAAY